MTSCPRCQAELRAGQDWCLECGAAARTRLARPAAWRLPVVAVAAIVAFAGLAASFAFVRLANTDPDVRAAQSATAATTATQPAAPPATTTTTAPQPSPFTTTTTTPTAP
jgi:hypothetical protein